MRLLLPSACPLRSLAFAALLAFAGGAAADDPLSSATADDITRGLIPAYSSTRGLMKAATPTVTNSYGDAVAATVNLAVEFEFNSAHLTERATALLDALGEALVRPELAQYRFLLGGHTDGVGSAEANLALSLHRAESTARYLVERYGIAPERLVIRAFGKTALLLPDYPEDARNRRVEVSTLAPGTAQ